MSQKPAKIVFQYSLPYSLLLTANYTRIAIQLDSGTKQFIARSSNTQ